MNKIAVYTTMIGDHYSVPGFVEAFHDSADFFCFKGFESSDLHHRRAAQNGWELICANYMRSHRRDSKFFKIMSCLHFSTYHYSIWVDSTHTPNVDPKEIVEHYLDDHLQIAVFRHPSFESIKQEAEACIEFEKAPNNEIRYQLRDYQELGIDTPLVAGNVIIRKRCPEVAAFEVDWFSQILRYSSRDQLGFAYAEHCHRDSVMVNRICANVYHNEMFSVGGHASGARELAKIMEGSEHDLFGSVT